MLYIVRQLMSGRLTCLMASQVGPPPFLVFVGVDVPEPSIPVPDSKSSTIWGQGGSDLRNYRIVG